MWYSYFSTSSESTSRNVVNLRLSIGKKFPSDLSQFYENSFHSGRCGTRYRWEPNSGDREGNREFHLQTTNRLDRPLNKNMAGRCVDGATELLGAEPGARCTAPTSRLGPRQDPQPTEQIQGHNPLLNVFPPFVGLHSSLRSISSFARRKLAQRAN